MKQQFLDLTGLTELVAYIENNVTDKKEILPYASNKLFPSTGDVNAIYIDTATNTIYRWDTSSKTYIILAKAVKSVSISESTENGKITLTVDGVKTTVPIHGLGSAAYTNSNAYSPANHTHTKAQIGLGSVDNTADKDKSVKHANTADSATAAGTATTATNVSAEIGQADIARHVWFSDNYTETKRNYNDNFKYNPTTNTVTANISGSAASANSVLWSGVTNKPSTFTPSSHNHDDSTITSLNASKLFGIIDIARLPHGALERLVIVEDDTARFKLTTANVQLGDTVKVIKTEKMYYVVDESKLSSEAGYSVYTAGTATSVPWSGVTGKPSSYPPASHNHDERYYTETEMNSKLAEKAPKVHTHVKNEVGLGNVDNTADANKSVKYAASAGTAASCTGNAATATTATKLATARSINGTNFDGSGNITTASWGTARNVTIGNTKKSVNGGSDVSWSLGEIGAAAASHSHSYLPLSGGTMTGNIAYKGSKATYGMIKFIDNVVDQNGNGIAIGGGGLTIVGGGESSDIVKTIASSGGDERLILSNDGPIDIYTNCQDGLSKATHVTIDNSGLYSGTAAKANSVPWSGVTGKPSTYTPSSHTHKMTDISDWGSYIYDVHASRTANTVLAAPSGSNGSATFRKLVAADIPTLTKSKISDFPGSLPASDVYAWAKASTKPSYSWGEITGKPGTFTPASHSHYSLTTIGDQRSTATSPNSYSNNLIFQGLKGNSTIGISNAGNYSYVLGLRGWNDSSGGNSHELAFNNSGIYTRNGATSWGTWKQLLDSSNYTSYTVTKSGSGASGTWSINVTGSAGSVAWGNVSGKPSTFTPSSHTHNYLPLSGGTMSGTAMITWPDSGNWSNSNKNVTFPVIRGGLSWLGQSDGIQLYAVETQNDNLELYLKFIDDNSNGLSIINSTNTQTARISATGEITASKFVGNLAGTASSASAVPWSGITGKPSTFAPASHSHNKVSGAYTGNGGQQKPNYFGTNQVGFLMMNTAVNNNTHYKDWIIMDCYSGTDVGGAVAFGVNRQSLGAYIMRSESGRTSWSESAELLHTANYNSYAPTKTGGGASGTWGINITGSSTSCSGNAGSATKLQTARTINGTSFNGSANITTANWGTARTITVGNTGKSVNGSGNVSWSLGEIGIHVSNKEPAASEGKNGDVWIVYEG